MVGEAPQAPRQDGAGTERMAPIEEAAPQPDPVVDGEAWEDDGAMESSGSGDPVPPDLLTMGGSGSTSRAPGW